MVVCVCNNVTEDDIENNPDTKIGDVCGKCVEPPTIPCVRALTKKYTVELYAHSDTTLCGATV